MLLIQWLSAYAGEHENSTYTYIDRTSALLLQWLSAYPGELENSTYTDGIGSVSYTHLTLPTTELV